MRTQLNPGNTMKIGQHKCRFRFGFGGLMSVLLVACMSGRLSAQSKNEESLEVNNLWLEDITIESLKPTIQLSPAYVPLWMEALRHSETDLKQEIVATLERVHRQGVDQLGIASEIRGMVSDSNHHTLNMALASLLIAIDDKDSAKLLFGLLKPGRVELSQVIEPALAAWDYPPMRDIWDGRISQEKVRRTLLLLAIEGLSVVRNEASGDRLIEIAMDRNEKSTVRISAARAAGAIRSQGLVEFAQQLIRSDSKNSTQETLDGLCAVALLSRHTTVDATNLLQQLLLNKEASVAGAAWKRLLEIDSALAVPFANACRSSRDSAVRLHVVTALREQPSLERLDWLAQLTDDPHPDIRIGARVALVELAAESGEFDKQIRVIGMKFLKNSPASYPGVEQILILLATLDHKEAAGLALEMLCYDHPKVRVAAAWCLRVLQVKGAFPAMLQRATEVTEAVLKKGVDQNFDMTLANLDQVAHFFDAFGNTGYQDAEELMRRFVPKNHDLGNNSRPAAIIAIGKLNAGDANYDLIRLMIKRMHDQESDTAESSELCAACAITLGRLKAVSALADIERYYDGDPPVSGLHYAAAWAIRELTGRDFPEPASPIVNVSGFSLEPFGARLHEK